MLKINFRSKKGAPPLFKDVMRPNVIVDAPPFPWNLNKLKFKKKEPYTTGHSFLIKEKCYFLAIFYRFFTPHNLSKSGVWQNMVITTKTTIKNDVDPYSQTSKSSSEDLF